MHPFIAQIIKIKIPDKHADVLYEFPKNKATLKVAEHIQAIVVKLFLAFH